ncbi:MAG: hypothetical protein U0S48_16530 [Solirubrobacteraceae bacterium]
MFEGDVGALEQVGAQVEQLGDAQRSTNSSAQICSVPSVRCSMKTTFQLSNRSASIARRRRSR